MIPLGRWLQQGSGENFDQTVPPVCASAVSVSKGEEVVVAKTLTSSDDVDRDAGLRNEILVLQKQIDLERLEAVVRERELSEQLGSYLMSEIERELTSGMTALQTSIESAVCEVLLPFIEQEAVRKAASELTSLFRETVTSSPEPILLAKAPLHLHSFLLSGFEKAGLSVALLESNEIELDFGSHRSRFEELTARWIAKISEPSL